MNQIFVTPKADTPSYNSTVVSQNNMDVYNNLVVKQCIAEIVKYQNQLHCLNTCMCCYHCKITELLNCLCAKCCG